MDISGIIKSLLLRHNCVIIPGFGGLVAEYAPAQIHPIQHIFLPPHKSLAFNRSIKINDGLLVAAMAREGSITYEEAVVQLQQFVRQLESGLKTKGSYVLPYIGKFYYDVEKNLLFKAEENQNYLLPAFGLDQFIAQPVMRREEVISAIETSFVQPKKKRRLNWMGLGVLLALAVLVLQFFMVSPDTAHLQESGLYRFVSHLFSARKVEATQPAEHRKDTLIQIVIIQNQTSMPVDTAAIIANATQAEATKVPVTIESKPIEVSKPAINSGDYFVIFGCFKGKRAPQVLIEELKKKNIHADIVIDDAFRRVGIGGFATREAAVEEMKSYHTQGIKDAWVMKK